MIDMEPNTTLVQQFPAHEAVPEAGPGALPSVVVLHDIFGLDEHARNIANRLARQGFYALAPDLYAMPFSTAAGAPDWMAAPYRAAGSLESIGLPTHSSFAPGEAESARGRAQALSDERALAVIRAALAHLDLVAEASASGIGVVGFGMGGRLAFLASCELPTEVGGGVVFSGGGIASPNRHRPAERLPILEFEKLRAPLLLFYGAQDEQVRQEERDAVEAVLTSSEKPHEIVTFREAGHEFFNEESAEYRISAAREAWEKTLDFLDRHVAGSRA